jgi:O-antigen ligase/polysaccharide polymerase Wzy-like membrane protein
MESATLPPPLRRALQIGALIAPLNFWVALSVGGMSLRPLHLWVLAYGSLLIIRYRGELLRPFSAPTLAMVSMYGALVVSTIFATPDEYRGRAVQDLLLLALNIGAFACVRGALADRPEAARDFVHWLSAGAAFSALALTGRALLASTSTTAVGEDSFALGLGTVAGTFTTAFAAAAQTAVVFAPTRRYALAATGIMLVSGTAAILSLARGPWIGFALSVPTVIGIGAWQLRRARSMRGLVWRVALPSVALLVASVGLIAFNGRALRLVIARVLDLGRLTGGTASSRLQLWTAMTDDFLYSPVFGHGAAAYRRLSQLLGIQTSVSENFAIEVLHAGGVVAAMFLASGVGLCVGASLRHHDAPGRDTATLRLAVLAGTTTMLIGALTNPAGWDGLFWVVLACAASPAQRAAV